jgi:hypothetical protein
MAAIDGQEIMNYLSIASCVLLAGCAATSGSQTSSDDEMLDKMMKGEAPRSTLSAAEQAEVTKHPLGSERNPVLAEGPPGERAYILRLRCPEGSPPSYERLGSASVLSPYGSVMDMYELACDAPPARTIFIDMYHPGHVEARAVPGFVIVDP